MLNEYPFAQEIPENWRKCEIIAPISNIDPNYLFLETCLDIMMCKDKLIIKPINGNKSALKEVKEIISAVLSEFPEAEVLFY